jgi:hypothetical protein
MTPCMYVENVDELRLMAYNMYHDYACLNSMPHFHAEGISTPSQLQVNYQASAEVWRCVAMAFKRASRVLLLWR